MRTVSDALAPSFFYRMVCLLTWLNFSSNLLLFSISKLLLLQPHPTHYYAQEDASYIVIKYSLTLPFSTLSQFSFSSMESQSQMLSPIFDPDLAPIPLEKYSSAVSPEGSRNYRWVHDVRKELALSFKTVDIPIVANQYEKRLLMTIDAGKGPLVSIFRLSCLSFCV